MPSLNQCLLATRPGRGGELWVFYRSSTRTYNVLKRAEIHLWHHPLGEILCRHKVSAPSSLIGIMHKLSRRSAWVLSAPDMPLTYHQFEG